MYTLRMRIAREKEMHSVSKSVVCLFSISRMFVICRTWFTDKYNNRGNDYTYDDDDNKHIAYPYI